MAAPAKRRPLLGRSGAGRGDSTSTGPRRWAFPRESSAATPHRVYSGDVTRKRRVQLYLNGETYDRAQAILKVIPGVTVSAMVDEVLERFVASMEPVVKAALDGNREAAFRLLNLEGNRSLAEMAAMVAEVAEGLHTNSGDGGTPPVPPGS